VIDRISRVVPANAGTRNSVPYRFGTKADTFFRHWTRWLWVPAFAGTTRSLIRDDGSLMAIADKLVLQRHRHLKWQSFDGSNWILMIICGVLCFGFSLSVTCDIVTRTIGILAVAAGSHFHAVHLCDLHRCGGRHPPQRSSVPDRDPEAMHGTPRMIVEIIIRMVVLGVAFVLIWYGYLNYIRGFGSFRLPSGTPIASLYAIIPLSGS